MITVKVVYPEGREEDYSFDKSSVMIGRSSGNDIALDISGLSRYHARIGVEEGELVVEDLGSKNGTFVNGEKVEQRRFQTSDIVSIGPVTFKVKFIPSESSGMMFEEQPSLGSDSFNSEAEGEMVSGELPEQPAVAQSVGQATANENRESARKSEDFYWQSLKSFLSPVWQYLNDDAVSEIMINGPSEIYIEKRGRLEKVDAAYQKDQLSAAVLNIAQYVGRRVSEEEPYLDARLPDGSRVAVLMPPCSRKGISIAIRKFSKEKLTIEKLLEFGSLSPEMVQYLRAAVILKKNILVSGGTSSGKTSLLNVVSSLIPDDERIVTIEDSAELQLRQEHVLPMETRPPDKKGRGQITIRDLVRASLRMRPDRIIVGEIRGGEALDLLQAMNTGHSGSMATVHASSPRQALTRMETLALFSGLEIPARALREQVSSALEVIIQASRLPDHSRKVVYISEVNSLGENGEYQVTDIFKFVRTGFEKGKVIGSHSWTGAQTGMIEEMELAGLSDVVNFFRAQK